MKALIASSFLFLFLLTLGPPLPFELSGFSILEIHGDVYVIGGWTDVGIGFAGRQSAIYQLTCSSGLCSWTTLKQQLKVPRYNTVAIPVPESFCTT